MLVTITEYTELATDGNGNKIPVGLDPSGRQELTADGTADPIGGGSKFVRIATDTAIRVDGDLIMPGAEFFAVYAGQELEVATA